MSEHDYWITGYSRLKSPGSVEFQSCPSCHLFNRVQISFATFAILPLCQTVIGDISKFSMPNMTPSTRGQNGKMVRERKSLNSFLWIPLFCRSAVKIDIAACLFSVHQSFLTKVCNVPVSGSVGNSQTFGQADETIKKTQRGFQHNSIIFESYKS